MSARARRWGWRLITACLFVIGLSLPLMGTGFRPSATFFTNPTLTGTVAGTPTWASAQTFPGLTLTGNLAGGSNTVTAATVNATTAYQFNSSAFATASASPADPTGTTSTTGVMMGLAGSITTRTGRAVVIVTGTIADSIANDGGQVQIRYGTGTAPTNGAALTGTAVGSLQQFTAGATAAAKGGFAVAAVVTGLTGGTAYWLDLSLAAITGGTATITGVSIAAFDIS